MIPDHTSLVSRNKLSLPISFKSTLTKAKLKFRRTQFPEFLKFQKFLKLHHNLYKQQEWKLKRQIMLPKMFKPTQRVTKKKTPKQLQPQPQMLFPQLHQAKLQKFYKMNTKNFQMSMKTLQNQIKQWKKKWKT